ncbi:MAG TPA: hypothetical protein VLY24_00840 [Bryobacteraceae bacterium]|nr:hypothetical protein [Bryobacteraceae bacterium]
MRVLTMVLATGALAIVASAQNQLVNAPPDAYQVRYAANFIVGDSVVDLTNAATAGGYEPQGDICASVYVFGQDQQLVACCACQLTPNHLKTLSVRSDLINNTLTPGVPTGVTIALLASKNTTCNAAFVAASDLVGGLRAWGTALHAAPSGGYAVGETPFSNAPLSSTELQKMTSYCGYIQAIGSGYGLCSSCRTGSQGATRQ